MAYKAITISGEACTGKSLLARKLEDLLPGWKRIDFGNRFREICALEGLTIKEVRQLPDEIHAKFDALQLKILESESKIILEGRLAGWLTRERQEVLKVYCFTQFDIRVLRYVKREGVTKKKAISDLQTRDSGDLYKFKKVHKVTDYRNPAFYDLYLDTSNHTPLVLAETILNEMDRDIERN